MLRQHLSRHCWLTKMYMILLTTGHFPKPNFIFFSLTLLEQICLLSMLYLRSELRTVIFLNTESWNSGNCIISTGASPLPLFHSRAVLPFTLFLMFILQTYLEFESHMHDKQLYFDVTIWPGLCVLYFKCMRLMCWKVICKDLFVFLPWLSRLF